MVFQEGVLNLFTDGSCDNKNKTMPASCACLAVIYDPVKQVPVIMDQKSYVIENATSNIAELSAIDIGVMLAQDNQMNFNRINLFSDSRISVLGLRDWIWDWVRRSKYNETKVLISTSGEPVKNQILIKNIVAKINTITQCIFCIYHQKGHCMNDLERGREQFYLSNGIYLDIEDVKLITYYNDLTDQFARQTVAQFRQAQRYTPVSYTIGDINMKQYYQVMKRRNF